MHALGLAGGALGGTVGVQATIDRRLRLCAWLHGCLDWAGRLGAGRDRRKNRGYADTLEAMEGS